MVASARSSSDLDDAFWPSRSRVRVQRLAGQVAVGLQLGHLRLQLGVIDLEQRRALRATGDPSRTRIWTTRPSTSGRSSIDCMASIWPVARMASTTVSARAAAASTGMAGGPPPPGPPGVRPRLCPPTLPGCRRRAPQRSRVLRGSISRASLFVKSLRPRMASSRARAQPG